MCPVKWLKICVSVFFVFLGGALYADDSEGKENFDFVLHDGLEMRDVAHLRAALKKGRAEVVDAFEVATFGNVKVQIWRDDNNYQDAMEAALGSRAPGSRGYVFGPGEVRLLYHTRLSAGREAVHELVHAVTLHINESFGNNPRWLWEAVPLYFAAEFVEPATTGLFKEGGCPTLQQINAPFNAGGSIYSVGYLLTDFIIQTWGMRHLMQLITANGDIEKILDVSVQDFEQRWCTSVQEKYMGG